MANPILIGRGSSASVYTHQRRNGTLIVEKKYNDKCSDEFYAESEREQLRDTHFALTTAQSKIVDDFWLRDNKQLMRWKGPTLEQHGGFSLLQLQHLGQFIKTTTEEMQAIGIAMPDWKPSNICFATCIGLQYENICKKHARDAVDTHLVGVVQKLTAAMHKHFAGRLFSIEHRMSTLHVHIDILVDAATAELMMDRRPLLCEVLFCGVSPTVSMRTQYSMIDFNAMYIMDKATTYPLLPGRGTFCPFGRNIECVFDDRLTMQYGTWFAAALCMAWARLRCLDAPEMTPAIAKYIQLACTTENYFQPINKEQFLQQHMIVQTANKFDGGVMLPSPHPVVEHLAINLVGFD